MRKKWKRYKNRIMALGMALSISCSSVFLPSMEVMASSSKPEPFVSDLNGDGSVTLDEIRPFEFLSYCLTSMGYFFKEGSQTLIEELQVYRDWLALQPTMVVGWIDNSNMFTVSDEMWDKVREITSAIRGGDGFTQYPAMPADRMYYYSQTGYSFTAENLSSFLGSKYDKYFLSGTAVRANGSNNFYFCNPKNFYGQTSGGDPNYIDNFANYIYIAKDGWIFPYTYDGNSTFEEALCSNWYHTLGTFNSTKVTTFSESCRDSNTEGRTALCKTTGFLGLIGYSVVVFDSANSALAYLKYDRTFFDGSEYGVYPKLSLDAINGGEWWTLNNYYHNELMEELQNLGSSNISDSQNVINEYTKEVLSSLEFIEGENVQQTSFLKRIYELLKEWLPKIGNKDTNVDVDVDVNIDEDMGQFDDESNNQSDKLDGLIQDSQVEKPDIDNTNQLVDENLDMGNVEEYGTLLSVFTGNQRILSFILISLTVGLIAYVFYGKR